jgi:hypothetical protein
MFFPNNPKRNIVKIFFIALLLGFICPLVIWSQALGDVNSDGMVDIMDALLTAQYYVGMNPQGFQITEADVDGNGTVDIVDALLIAQFYVGLITVFPGEPQPTVEPTQEPGLETLIQLNGNSIDVNGLGATVDGTNVIITAAGTYTIGGTLNDGRIIVETDDESPILINLEGINIYSSINSPFSVMNAPEGVEIVLMENTRNYITDSSTYVFENPDEDEPNAALFAKDDLDITGDGELIVDANYNDGIACKDDMNIKDCTIEVDSVDDGIRGKNSLEIKSGATITVHSAGDCLKSDDEEDGLIEIKKCTLDLTSTGGDGMDAEIQVTITHEESIVNIKTGGGSTVPPNEDISTKGIKGVNSVIIEDGIITVNSSDDAIHSNDEIMISGGTLNLATGDDGIHADHNITISGGTIDITQSYEGIESEYVIISGGDTHITADNDGINVFQLIEINDGIIIISAGSQGIQSDNEVFINSGFIEVTRCNEGIEAKSINIAGGSFIGYATDDALNGTMGERTESNDGSQVIISGGSHYLNSSRGD